MKKFVINFEELIKNHHQVIISVNEGVSESDIDQLLNELEKDCYTFSDVLMGLKNYGVTLVDSLEDEGVGEIEFDYLAETDLTECQ